MPCTPAMTMPALRRARSPWPVAILLTTCFTLAFIDRQIISLLAGPIKASLHLSDTQMGLVQGLGFSLFYVLASLPLACLADRDNRPRIMACCIALWSIMTMVCGLATHFWHLLLARTGVAVGEAGLPPSAVTMMADLFPPGQLARAVSVFMLAPFIGGGIAMLGGGALYGWLANVSIPALPIIGTLERWQLVFVIVGAPGLLLAGIVALLIDPRATAPSTASRPDCIELTRFILREWKLCALYILIVALIAMLFSAHISWMPAAIMRAYRMDEQTIGPIFGPIYLLAGGAGTCLAGAVLGRARDNIAGRTIRFMQLGAMLLLPAAVLAPLLTDLTMQMILIACAIFLTSSVISLSSLPLQFIVPPHLRAQSVALLGLVAALLGSGLGPLIVGLLSDHLFAEARHPLSAALSTIGAVSVGSALLLFDPVIRCHERTRLDLQR